MIEIARLVSRPEAMTVQAMLDAAGIPCHIGGQWHSLTEGYILALGGFRLTVPICHYATASAVLREAITEPPEFNYCARKRIAVLLALVGLFNVLPVIFQELAYDDEQTRLEILLSPLILTLTPVPPQGRGSWYLAAAPDEVAA